MIFQKLNSTNDVKQVYERETTPGLIPQKVCTEPEHCSIQVTTESATSSDTLI